MTGPPAVGLGLLTAGCASFFEECGLPGHFAGTVLDLSARCDAYCL